MAKIKDEAWKEMICNITEKFTFGELIPHEYLEYIFLLDKIAYKDFNNQDEFLEAIKLQQFEYMTLIDKLRWDLLDQYKIYLKTLEVRDIL